MNPATCCNCLLKGFVDAFSASRAKRQALPNFPICPDVLWSNLLHMGWSFNLFMLEHARTPNNEYSNMFQTASPFLGTCLLHIYIYIYYIYI